MNQKLLEEIGQILYQKRIKKKYSLEQISEITKIPIKNLEFIEHLWAGGEIKIIYKMFLRKSFILMKQE